MQIIIIIKHYSVKQDGEAHMGRARLVKSRSETAWEYLANDGYPNNYIKKAWRLVKSETAWDYLANDGYPNNYIKKAWLWLYGYFGVDELHLQLQNPNIATMFALFMLFTTIIAPLIPTLSSQPPPLDPTLSSEPPPSFSTFPSLTPRRTPPAPAFKLPPIPPFTPSPPNDNILPSPSQEQSIPLSVVLEITFGLTISITLTVTVTVAITRGKGDKGEPGKTGKEGPKGEKGSPCMPGSPCRPRCPPPPKKVTVIFFLSVWISIFSSPSFYLLVRTEYLGVEFLSWAFFFFFFFFGNLILEVAFGC